MPEPAIPLASLPFEERLQQLFGPRVVNKAFGQAEAFGRLPRYVSEYLISKYVKPATAEQDLEKIKAQLRERLPDTSRREWLKDQLVRQREYVIIDQVEVRVDLKSGQRWGFVPALDDRYVSVPAEIVDQNPGLLAGGMWGTVKLRWKPEANEDHPVALASFTPFQVDVTTVDDVIQARKHFTLAEWTQLMLASVGLSTTAFPSERLQVLVLSRLIPLVERNVNLVELGPRQTGKTFLLRNTSPQVFLVSGGKTTPASLFGNLATRTPGVFATRKVVVFDEIGSTNFDDAKTTVSVLKDYLESGQFSRGTQTHAAEASTFFAGNLDVENGRPHSRYRHCFEPLPEELQDTAFLDRLHGFLPGWEIPKISRSTLATGPGFVIDYFGEYLLRLRQTEFRGEVRRLTFNQHLTQRDLVAVERLTAGLLKLLYPDGSATDSEVQRLASYAVEYRQRVHDQLAKMAPGEFKGKKIAFEGLVPTASLDAATAGSEAIERYDRLNHEAVVGEATGLATVRDGNAAFGDLIVVEAALVPGKGEVTVVGGRGKILRESVKAAFQYVRSHAADLGINPAVLDKSKLALHLLHIAEEREGPSAGVTFVTAMVSAATRRPVKPALAMTGEVSLLGKVTEVGGLPQKLEAAARAGRKVVIIPRANAADVSTVPDEILDQLEIIPVESVEELLAAALEASPRQTS